MYSDERLHTHMTFRKYIDGLNDDVIARSIVENLFMKQRL